MEESAVLSVERVTRRFGPVTANDDVSLEVRPGELLGLLGHNGAGKTTLVSQIVGLLRPHAGAIRVGGIDAVADPAAARRRIALQAQSQAPIDGLTPRTAIEITARIRGLSRRDARAAAVRLGEELDIGEWLDRRALPEGAGLSGGIRRLTAFAMTVAAPVPLLVFDEPSNDVDAARRRLLWEAVRRRADEGAGVLLVTHNVTEAERVVDELVILDRGSVVAAGAPARLRGARGGELRLELELTRGGADPDGMRAAAPFAVAGETRLGHRLRLSVDGADAAIAVDWAAELRRSGAIDGFSLTPVTLEDAYLTLTGALDPELGSSPPPGLCPDPPTSPDREADHG